eukprot:CAMPEP_0202905746 /NCGR_PEP_ID=MMETSP1392-20130828/35847_1 /ASSEMBLY_ACC=CAM_ASM_000868 /TAXON_ID=225041 /ORGANISM="Chlamydomonas chlamydogama, Strain SAG 11-48b" /LENGTH=104 /DNA_ID=CAMNT_0049593995 /DNA_START=43 /DNA_END=354 /DNA_ORIENTATION=-
MEPSPPQMALTTYLECGRVEASAAPLLPSSTVTDPSMLPAAISDDSPDLAWGCMSVHSTPPLPTLVTHSTAPEKSSMRTQPSPDPVTTDVRAGHSLTHVMFAGC